MLSETDHKILKHLRANSRKSLASIARDVGLPHSTLFDRVRSIEQKCVRKHTTLIDFDRLGFFTRVQIAVEVPIEKRQQLQDFLNLHKNINSLYKINRGFDFMLDCIFRSPAEAKKFIEELQSLFGITKTIVFDMIEDLRREEFLPCPENLTK